MPGRVGVESLALSLLDPTDRFPPRHIGPSDPEIAEMLGTLGLSSLDALVGETVPEGIRLGKPLALPSARGEREVLEALRAHASRNQVFRSFIGMGYHGCLVPGGHPAERAREPGLVHAVHALPGRDRPGPAGGAPELPDDGGGPHRPAARQRLPARRGHRRGGGDAHVPRPRQGRPPRLLRGRRLPPADDRGGEDAGAAARHRRARGARGVGRLRERRALRRAPAVPDDGRPRSSTTRRSSSARTPRGRWWRSPPTSSPSTLLRPPGRVRRRHRRRLQPALRRAHGLRRAARRLPGHARRAQAPDAGPHRGRLEGRRGPARPTGWPCRRASSTSGATRPRATSAPPRCCSRSWRACTRSITGPRGSTAIARRVHALTALLARGLAPPGTRRGRRSLLRHPARSPGPGWPAERVARRARERGVSTCGPTPTARWGSPSTRP